MFMPTIAEKKRGWMEMTTYYHFALPGDPETLTYDHRISGEGGTYYAWMLKSDNVSESGQ